MVHFGVLSHKGTGHLTPLFALSQMLVARGHRVTFFLPEEIRDIVQAHGLEFVAIAVKKRESAKLTTAKLRPQSTRDWIRDTSRRIHEIDQELLAYHNAYLEAIPGHAVDALILGEMALAGPIVAEVLVLPYFVISTTIPHNFSWRAPKHLRPRYVWQERVQKWLLEVSIFNMHGPIRKRLQRHRRSRTSGTKSHSELAHITQWPEALDVCRTNLPERFYYTGPFAQEAARMPQAFPWELLDGRLLVYASLGTTKRGEVDLFERIAKACASLDVQLVIALGGRSDAESVVNLPGDPIICARAPQLELLVRADVVITHAGPNTVLETLLQGKPMLALPLGLDQPAVAARLEVLHCAVTLGPKQRTPADVRNGLETLLRDDSYRKAAEHMRQRLREGPGSMHAAELIETHLGKHYRAHRVRG